MTLIDLAQVQNHLCNLGSRDDGDSRDWATRENDFLRPMLFATARKYNQTYKELESLKELHGFYKHPLPFLLFPREIRDKIYFYALRSPLTTSTTTRYAMYFMEYFSEPSPFKPPTPGLVYANKQVYREATEVLYSRNIFKFKSPKVLFDFENQMGPVNCGHIRHVSIWSVVPNEGGMTPLPETLIPDDWEEYQSHWARALQLCSFQNVNEMTIEVECPGAFDNFYFCNMELSLRDSVEELIFRSRQSRHPRRITLRGFDRKEWEKFSSKIEVTTRQWPDVEEEIRALEEELAEGLQADREAAEAAWATGKDEDDKVSENDSDSELFEDDNDDEVYEDALENLSTQLGGL